VICARADTWRAARSCASPPQASRRSARSTRCPRASALIEYWRQRLGDSGKRKIFDVVVDAHPRAIAPEAVAEKTGITIGGGTWRTYLGELRGLELITGRGELRASDDLFR
jgi:hypothetical protein